jgi:hypothetical protein
MGPRNHIIILLIKHHRNGLIARNPALRAIERIAVLQVAGEDNTNTTEVARADATLHQATAVLATGAPLVQRKIFRT